MMKTTKSESGTWMPSYHRCRVPRRLTLVQLSLKTFLVTTFFLLDFLPVIHFFSLSRHPANSSSLASLHLPEMSSESFDPFSSVLLHHSHHPRLLLRVELAHDRPHAALRQRPGLVHEVVLEAEVGREDLLHQGVVHATQRAQASHLSDGRDAALSGRLRGKGSRQG